MFRTVNKDFFKVWTPEMAYVLGFFAADGWISHNKRGAYFLCIQITDEDLLQKIRSAFQSTHKISKRVMKSILHKQSFRLQIGSKEMCYDLNNLGFTVRKTHIMLAPQVPEEFLFDFVRGYFDGDGNVWVGLTHKERKTSHWALQSAFTSCSGLFLKSLMQRLSNYGLKGRVQKIRSYYRLVYSIKSSLLLYDLMYKRNNDNLYLARKKAVFERYKLMRP